MSVRERFFSTRQVRSAKLCDWEVSFVVSFVDGVAVKKPDFDKVYEKVSADAGNLRVKVGLPQGILHLLSQHSV